MSQIILDVETKKIFDEVGGFFPEKLGISFVGVCYRENSKEKGKMMSFFEKDLPKMFELIEKTDLLIGYNLDAFDIPALAPYYSGDLSKFQTLDLMIKIKDSCGHRIGLDAVSKATFNMGKTGSGLDAIKYYRSGQLSKLESYCLQDVRLTRDVYDYGLKNNSVKFHNKWNRLVECPVDFKIKIKKNIGVQKNLLQF